MQYSEVSLVEAEKLEDGSFEITYLHPDLKDDEVNHIKDFLNKNPKISTEKG